ncbi:DUF6241 domain-containing protein [Oceanobacillus kimchii]|uniref:DUF6241 domain-containing protein n=1 Tax=Oceanobacillus kimchii TaxID=746691 RepID=UPI0009849816|nr:DUF6241 domain-containing protein [Oceanobacillus kimchii]
MTTKKWAILFISALLLTILSACGEETSASEEENSSDEKKEALEEKYPIIKEMHLNAEEYTEEELDTFQRTADAISEEDEDYTPPHGWTMERQIEIHNNFGDLIEIEHVNKEIVQMTSQKIESKQIKELVGEDYSFTPAYPLSQLDQPEEYAAITEDNLLFLKIALDDLEKESVIDEKTNDYYQEFLDEWLNDDFSNLIKVHKELLSKVSSNKDYLEVDDLELATEEQEQAYIEHYDLKGQ